MADACAFVYAVCGAAVHIDTLHRSLQHLRARTRWPILVVTDLRRNAAPIVHDAVIDVPTPPELDHHQASIFLKTGLHRWLPPGRLYAYLDADILAVGDAVDTLFDHHQAPVSFARDLTHLGNRVRQFSPWAMRCGCRTDDVVGCTHLPEAIERAWQVAVDPDWLHWNGGLFIFGPEGHVFLQTWHARSLTIFQDPAWRTRDQGTLIATVWSMGLQHQPCLPSAFNVIVCNTNPDLLIDVDGRASVHPAVPADPAQMLHLMDAALERPDWRLDEELAACRTRHAAHHAVRAESVVRGQLAVLTLAPACRALAHGGVRSSPAQGAGSTEEPAARIAQAARPVTVTRVVVSCPHLEAGVVVDPAERLVRLFCEAGIDATLLLTESDTDRVAGQPCQRPAGEGVPARLLPAHRAASWGGRWGAMVATLESLGPCLHLSIGDWRHAVVAPRLSAAICSVGVARPGNAVDLDQWVRLGDWWAAVWAADPATADALRRARPDLASRVQCLDWIRDPAASALLEALQAAWRAAPATPSGPLLPPPAQVGSTQVLPVRYSRGVQGIGVFPSLRTDYDDYRAQVPASPAWEPGMAQALHLLAVPSRQPRAPINTILDGLVPLLAEIDRPARMLAGVGLRARLRGRPVDLHCPWLRVVPGSHWPVPWLRHAQGRRLHDLAPGVMFTSDASDLGSWEPWLARRLAVVGRVDETSPVALRRIAARARHWSLVVAASPAIGAALAAWDGSLAARTLVIPAASDSLSRPAPRPFQWQAPFRVLCTAPPPGSVAAQRLAALQRAFAQPISWQAGDPQLSLEIVAAQADDAAFGRADAWLSWTADASDLWPVARAMAAGCIPVLWPDGPADVQLKALVVDGISGLCLDGAAPADLVHRLRSLQTNPALARVLLSGGQDVAFGLLGDPSAIVRQHLAVLEQAMHRAVHLDWAAPAR